MISPQEKIWFETLKKRIIEVFREEFPNVEKDISAWKGLDIVYFQEHLRKKVKSNVSEKWFYTYFKSDISKLPRIDMLNMLSQYIGYTSWKDFTVEHSDDTLEEIKTEEIIESRVVKSDIQPTRFYQKKSFQYGSIFILLSAIAFLFFWVRKEQHTYVFSFIDTYSKNPINATIDVEIISQKGTLPFRGKVKNGYFEYTTYEDTIKMITNSAFYKIDTFDINLNRSQGKETLELTSDEYAMMLYYYSKSYKDFEQKRKYLNKIISDNALIYRDYGTYGYEIYSKEQYIDFLTLPTQSLKNFELIQSKEKNDKIIEIRFKIVQDETN